MMIIITKTDVTINEVTITMTGEEASHLLEIVQHVGGPPTGPRGTFDQISDGLTNAGVERSHGLYSKDISGGITIDVPNQT